MSIWDEVAIAFNAPSPDGAHGLDLLIRARPDHLDHVITLVFTVADAVGREASLLEFSSADALVPSGAHASDRPHCLIPRGLDRYQLLSRQCTSGQVLILDGERISTQRAWPDVEAIIFEDRHQGMVLSPLVIVGADSLTDPNPLIRPSRNLRSALVELEVTDEDVHDASLDETMIRAMRTAPWPTPPTSWPVVWEEQKRLINSLPDDDHEADAADLVRAVSVLTSARVYG